ncbi:hypothetical protein [Maricaulis maris]|uniref:Uncharacterized protein n=1 Tax=Maricaulis maris TaxID=74318 RepID=A0A495D1I7_9PROT|nr:hypothetical protein [Maricaulis maris]RKQ95422.1 hypothetical protein C7435_2524 [Maricaulis maris]
MATLIHDEVRTALVSVISAALAELDDPLDWVVNDPSYLDVDRAENFVRSRGVLLDGKVVKTRDDPLIGLAPSWDLKAMFPFVVEALGGEAADRQSRVSEVRQAIAVAITADYRLGGGCLYAGVTDFEPEHLKTTGVEISTLNAFTIEVEFVSLTPTG